MNDNTKIQALLVYFHHWGKDEIKATQDRKALHKTMDKIKTLFIDEDLDFGQDFNFLTEVRMMRFWVQYGHYGTMNFMSRMANVLLSNMGGCVGFDGLPKSRYYQFASSLNISVMDVIRLGMTDEEMLSVSAIVAL